ncbi:hypothetical protein CVT26_008732, partial [Gymnopilus dilepis]
MSATFTNDSKTRRPHANLIRLDVKQDRHIPIQTQPPISYLFFEADIPTTRTDTAAAICRRNNDTTIHIRTSARTQSLLSFHHHNTTKTWPATSLSGRQPNLPLSQQGNNKGDSHAITWPSSARLLQHLHSDQPPLPSLEAQHTPISSTACSSNESAPYDFCQHFFLPNDPRSATILRPSQAEIQKPLEYPRPQRWMELQAVLDDMLDRPTCTDHWTRSAFASAAVSPTIHHESPDASTTPTPTTYVAPPTLTTGAHAIQHASQPRRPEAPIPSLTSNPFFNLDDLDPTSTLKRKPLP